VVARFTNASNDPQAVQLLKKALEDGRLADEAPPEDLGCAGAL